MRLLHAIPRVERSRGIGMARSNHLFTIWYPDVSKICFPHIEQIPFLKAQPAVTVMLRKDKKDSVE